MVVWCCVGVVVVGWCLTLCCDDVFVDLCSAVRVVDLCFAVFELFTRCVVL